MAQHEGGSKGRGDRWTERLEQWHRDRNDQYQAEGWPPDTERDSSLGEYYPADEFYEYPGGTYQGNDYTGGGQPRSLADNRESGYREGYRPRNFNQPRDRHETGGRARGPYGRGGQHGRGTQYGEQSNEYRAGREEQGQFYDPGYGAGDWNSQDRFSSGRAERYGADQGGFDYGRSDYYRGNSEQRPTYRDWGSRRFLTSDQSNGLGAGMNFRGKGPKGYQRSDARILEDICERLSDDPSIDASEISVEVTQGKVTLKGQVYNRAMKHRAEDIVADCTGVKDIDNQLTLLGAMGARSPSRSSMEGAAWRNDNASTIPEGSGGTVQETAAPGEKK